MENPSRRTLLKGAVSLLALSAVGMGKFGAHDARTVVEPSSLYFKALWATTPALVPFRRMGRDEIADPDPWHGKSFTDYWSARQEIDREGRG
jgi:hypothetical protein